MKNSFNYSGLFGYTRVAPHLKISSSELPPDSQLMANDDSINNKRCPPYLFIATKRHKRKS